MASISCAVRRVKDDLTELVSADRVTAICQQEGYRWRRRQLGPAETLWLLLAQVLHFNTACSALRHVCGMVVSASAYCQARRRLPPALLQRLLGFTAGWSRACTDHLWHGHRTLHLDGSSFSMPHTPALDAHFGHPAHQKPGCSFPVAHLLALFDATTGMILHLIASPMRTHDQRHAALMHEYLQPGDALIADRGFCSYVHLALVFQRQMHAVFRLHQRHIVSFRRGRNYNRPGRKRRKGLPSSKWLRALGRQDQLVQWFKPKARPRWMSPDAFAALPDSLVLRELRYCVDRNGFRTQTVTLVTTLLDAERYPKQELVSLYERRWQVEVNLRHLKTTMRMSVLKCKTVAGVCKELYAFAIVYNLVRRVMVASASMQRVEPDRISFLDAHRWLQHGSPPQRLGALLVNPQRNRRAEPRAVKRRNDRYPRITKPREILRKQLESQYVIP